MWVIQTTSTKQFMINRKYSIVISQLHQSYNSSYDLYLLLFLLIKVYMLNL